MKLIYIALASFILAACAPIPPGPPANQEKTAADLAMTQSQEYLWPDKQWWHKYDDPQLNQLINQGLSNSPRLDVARARIRQAQAGLASAKSVYWPQINANYQMNRQLYSENYIYPPDLGGTYNTDNSLDLQLNFDLDLWGHNRALAQSAEYQTLAATADAEQSKTMLVSAIAQNYFQLQNANNQAKGIGDIVAKLKEALNITQDRYDNGLGNQVDVDQAKSALASAMVQLSQAMENAKLLHNSLAELTGQSSQQLADLQIEPLKANTNNIPAQLPMELLARRADIQAAKFMALASGAEISAAKADFYPNINLTAMAGFMSLGMDNLLRGSSKTYGVGPVISLPIFNAGKLSARLDSKRAQRDSNIALYNETVLQAVRELADAFTSINALSEQIEQQNQSMQAINSAYEVALARYKAGLGNFIQVLMAQNEALKQTIITTDLYSRASILDVQLNTALGGGYGDAPNQDTNFQISES